MASLTVKTALDDSGFQAGLKNMERGANQSATQVSTAFRKASREMEVARNRFPGGGGGGGFHPGVRVAGDAINAITGGRGAVMELRALEGLTGASLGVAVGVIAAYKGFEALRESVQKMNTATSEAQKELRGYNDAVTQLGSGTAGKAIEANDKLIASLKESRGLGVKVFDALTFGTKMIESRRAEIKLNKENDDIIDKTNAKIREETEEKEDSIGASEKELELQKNQHNLEKRRADIMINAHPELRTNLLHQADADADVEAKQIEHKFKLQSRGLEVERQISEIKKEGLSKAREEDKMAEVRIRQKSSESNDPMTSPEARDKAFSEMKGMEADLKSKQAERVKAIRREIRNNQIEADKDQDRSDTDNFRKQVEIHKQIEQIKARDGAIAATKAAEITQGALNRFDETKSGAIQGIINDPHHFAANAARTRHAFDRAQHRADRMMGLTPKDRARLDDVNNMAMDMKNKAQKLEADISSKSMGELLAGLADLVSQ